MSDGFSLDELFAPVGEGLALFEQELRAQIARLEVDHPRISALSRLGDRAVGHLLRAAAKRLRPALLLLSAESAGVRAGRGALVTIAVGVELIHTASLVHDDVIDEARARRGRLSVNAKFGNKIAVLAGDILYTHFFALLGGLSDVSPALRLRLLEMFTNVTKRMCFGEIYEERIRGSGRQPSVEDYLDTIENKTASLLSASCEAGALVACAGDSEVRSLRAYGHSVGMAYQLLDDLADADGIFRGEQGWLREAADGYLARAAESLSSLSANPATRRLGDLLSFIRLHGSSTPRRAVLQRAAAAK